MMAQATPKTTPKMQQQPFWIMHLKHIPTDGICILLPRRSDNTVLFHCNPAVMKPSKTHKVVLDNLLHELSLSVLEASTALYSDTILTLKEFIVKLHGTHKHYARLMDLNETDLAKGIVLKTTQKATIFEGKYGHKNVVAKVYKQLNIFERAAHIYVILKLCKSFGR
jgi:hypothetical protein